MRKLKEVLRLRFELGLSQGQIARSCSISQSAVSTYLKLAQASSLAWPLPEGWDEARLEETLLGTPRAASMKRADPCRTLHAFTRNCNAIVI